jgi:hypothetical protein
MATAAYHLGSNALLASKTFQGGSTQYAPLPADQWRAEMGRWCAVTLALLQQGFVGFVAGGSDDITRQAGVKSTILLDPGQIVLCWRQRVRNAAGVRNFGSGLFCWLFVLGWRLLWLGWGWTRLWDGSRRGRGMGRGAGGGGLLMACFSCSGWRMVP